MESSKESGSENWNEKQIVFRPESSRPLREAVAQITAERQHWKPSDIVGIEAHLIFMLD
jgi:hypothetical protein